MQEDTIGARRSTTLGNNNQPSGSDLYFAYGSDDSGQVLLEPSERDVSMASLDLEWDLGFATFTSTTSTYDHEGFGESDNGGLWASGGETDPDLSRDWNAAFYGGGWPRPMQLAQRGYDDSAVIQEFRLVSNESGAPLDWILGAFYMDQDNSVFQLSYNPGMNVFHNACVDTGGPECDGFWPAIFYPGDQLSEIDFEYKRDTSFEEMALYGELTWKVSDTFRLTGGFRWFDNETVNDVILGFPLVEGWTSPSAPQSRDADDDVLVKLNASWDISDTHMVYGTYSEGYRHGGAQSVPSFEDGDPFGEPNAEAIRTFKSDSVQNFEIGIKGSTETLRYTASLFRVDWKDPQLNTTSAWYGFYLAANGDEASTKGIELELEGYAGSSFHYRLGYTYVDGELEKDFISPQTEAVVAPAGSKLPGAPENVFSVLLDNTWELSGGMRLVAAFSAYYQSETQNFVNQGSTINKSYDAFTLMNVNATLAGDKWSAMLYVRNLGDEGGASGGFPSTWWSYDTGVFENWYGNSNRQFIVQPRTIGIKLGYRF
jgi:outer membrane receptor protein involved in Fe transport